jgi:hypothetical protein
MSLIQTGKVINGRAEVMRIRIHDRKRESGEPEHGRLNRFLHGISVDLSTAGSINIFDPLMNMDIWDVANTAINVAEMISGQSPLPEFQTLAIQVAVNKMFANRPDQASPELLLDYLLDLDPMIDVENYYRDMRARQLEKLSERDRDMEIQARPVMTIPENIPRDPFRHAAGQVAAMFGNLLEGKYGNIFTGRGSLRDKLSHPCVLFNWTGVEDQGRTILSSLFWKWQEIAERRGELELIAHVNLGDEIHEELENLMAARFYLNQVKKARSVHTFDLRATQDLADVSGIGGTGSLLSSLGERINLGVSGRFIGRQRNDPSVISKFIDLGMSRRNARQLTRLPTGKKQKTRIFAIHIPGEEDVVWMQSILTPLELEMIGTDSAAQGMTKYQPVTSFDSPYGEDDEDQSNLRGGEK